MTTANAKAPVSGDSGLNRRKKTKVTMFDAVLSFCMCVIVIVTIYPFWHVTVISFDASYAVNAAGFKLWPHKLSLDAYKVVFDYGTLWKGFMNSIIRVVLGTFLSVFMNMLTAYPLSKKELPFRKAYTTFLFITMLIGGGLIPNYLLRRYMNLMNTMWVLVVPGCVSAYNVFVVRNFYKSQPPSIEESAMIDGAGWLTIWIRLILPLSGPIMAVIGLWSAVGHWNSWYDAMLYVSDSNLITLPILLRRILIEGNSNEGSVKAFMKLTEAAASGTELQGKAVESAITMISVAPMLALYPFLQRYFVKGINVGSIKE